MKILKLEKVKKSICYNAASNEKQEIDMRHLPLTFPRATANGSFISLACANGVRLCYTVRKTMLGSWQLNIWLQDEPRSAERTHHFTSEKKAKDHARADFRRRQLVRLAA